MIEEIIMYMEVTNTALNPRELDEAHPCVIRARRTAFVARFIVLRESKRSRAHRVIELMEWKDEATAEEIAERFRAAFRSNGDKLSPVERDLRRALEHSRRSINFFIMEYEVRATLSFVEALEDYDRSNVLLFGDDEKPRPSGWMLPSELRKRKMDSEKNQQKEKSS